MEPGSVGARAAASLRDRLLEAALAHVVQNAIDAAMRRRACSSAGGSWATPYGACAEPASMVFPPADRGPSVATPLDASGNTPTVSGPMMPTAAALS